MINKINPPDGFYDPIVKEKLNFLEKGFSKTLNLNAKYKGLYDFGLEFEKKVLSTKHKFNGKFKLEFLVDAQILSEKTISAFKAWGSYFEDGYDTDYYKWIVLDTFEIPYQGKYLDNIKLRITVLEPDMELGKNQDFINIYIAASSIP
ncbi:MAG TPA: hypothetical protein VI749_01560 [Candidatus Omnitrophota bacterium]|nr:hypothetical protein [Candidatus Omnitrophota bacterium]